MEHCCYFFCWFKAAFVHSLIINWMLLVSLLQMYESKTYVSDNCDTAVWCPCKS